MIKYYKISQGKTIDDEWFEMLPVNHGNLKYMKKVGLAIEITEDQLKNPPDWGTGIYSHNTITGETKCVKFNYDSSD